jgi:lipopolysaccharide export system protein LptA
MMPEPAGHPSTFQNWMKKKLLASMLAGAATVLAFSTANAQGFFPLNFGAHLGSLSLSFTELDWNHKTGDFVIPGTIYGKSQTSDFRADRANGNDKAGFITLIGHVVVHSASMGQRAARTAQPLTITADQLRYDYRTTVYTATGDVRVVQAGATLTAPLIRLDDANRVANLSGGVHYQETNGRALQTDSLTYHTDSGDYLVPGSLSGSSPSEGSFSADSASGNSRRNDVTLVGDVVVHKLGGFRNIGNSGAPVTLLCDTLKIDGVKRLYTATGNARVLQGNRTMTAPLMQLNDVTHILTMTGGVKASEPPASSFQAPEVVYNTETEDFRAMGGVHATIPIRQFGKKSPSPKPTPAASKRPT